MALTLHTKDPFGGRIYPRDEIPGCEAQGRGTRETTLVMGLLDRRCGVSEDVSPETNDLPDETRRNSECAFKFIFRMSASMTPPHELSK